MEFEPNEQQRLIRLATLCEGTSQIRKLITGHYATGVRAFA